MSVRNNEILKTLHQKFGIEFPIVEATTPLRLQPKACDCEGADPKDPSNCILVHTAKRMYDAEAVIVWRSTAYALLPAPRNGVGIPFPGHAGNWRWERYIVRTDALEVLAPFDRGKPFVEGTAVMLYPPPHSAKRAVKRRINKAYRKTEAGRAHTKLVEAKGQLKRARAKMLEATASSKTASSKTASSKMASSKTASVKVAEAEKRVEAATRKFEAVRRRTQKKPAPKAAVFDLTTRNGAKGNYHFIPLKAAA